MSFGHLHIGTHTELGDLLVCEGLIRHHAAIQQHVSFFTRFPGHARVLFSDLPNVEPIPVDEKPKYTDGVRPPAPKADGYLWLGYFCEDRRTFGSRIPATGALTFDHLTWDREFYRQANVPFQCRWRRSRLPHVQRPSNFPKAAERLIHDLPEFRLDIEVPDPHTRIEPVEGHTLFSWMYAIVQAREIHCVDSSVCNLVESMFGNGYLNPWTDLYFHRGRPNAVAPTLMAPWNIV